MTPQEFKQWLGALPPEERIQVAEGMWQHIEGRKPGWEQLDALMANVNIHDFEDVAPTGGDLGDFMQFMFSLGPNALSWARQGSEHTFDQERTYATELAEAGLPWPVAGTVGTALDFLEPGPEALKAAKNVGPLLGLLAASPGIQRLLARTVAPSLVNEDGLIRTQYHGTPVTFTEPQAGAQGLHGAGHYTSAGRSKAGGYADNPRGHYIMRAGAGEPAPQVRFDTSLLQNPFHYPPHTAGRGYAAQPAALRFNEEGAAAVEELLARHLKDDAYLGEVQAQLERLRQRAAEGGATITHDEFLELVGGVERAALLERMRNPDGGLPNAQQLLGRALGVDGVVDDFMNEIVAFDPAASTVNTVESIVEYARRAGFDDAQIAAADPRMWRHYVEADPERALLQGTPLTELGTPQVPTQQTLALVAAEQGPEGVRRWLTELEVSPEAAERVAEAMEAALRATPEGADAAQQQVRRSLQAAYAEFMDPDSVKALMEVFEPPGPHSPLLHLDPRLYPERELAGLGRADLDELERIRQSVASGDDTWLGRAADDPDLTGRIPPPDFTVPSETATPFGPGRIGAPGALPGRLAPGVDSWHSTMMNARARGDEYFNEMLQHFQRARSSVSGGFKGQARVDELIDLPGARGEHLRLADGGNEHDRQVMAELIESMRTEGYHQDKPILIYVEADGRAHIGEGNHRIRAAQAAGLEHVPIDVRYFGGAEGRPGVWMPQALRDYLGSQ